MYYGTFQFPNLLLNLHPDCAMYYLLFPQGPGHTTVISEYLFRPETIAAASFKPDPVVELWDLISKQDWAVCERAQTGVGSRAYKTGVYPAPGPLPVRLQRALPPRDGPPDHRLSAAAAVGHGGRARLPPLSSRCKPVRAAARDWMAWCWTRCCLRIRSQWAMLKEVLEMTDTQRVTTRESTYVDPANPAAAGSVRVTESAVTPAGPGWATTASRIVTFAFGLLQALLILRIILLLLVANQDNDIVAADPRP